MSMSKTGLTKNFRVGQLASALRGMTNADPAQNFIGRIVSIDDESGDVVLEAYDKDQATVNLVNLKQAVHYDRDKVFYIEAGESADVFAIDHPILGPNEAVTTSTVLRHNKITGFFETKNTLYMANKIDFGAVFGLQTQVSPFLA